VEVFNEVMTERYPEGCPEETAVSNEGKKKGEIGKKS